MWRTTAASGGLRWRLSQQGDYTEDELKTRAGQKISDFNSGLGKAASYENSKAPGASGGHGFSQDWKRDSHIGYGI
ncbi:MAG: hypothetical protein ACLR0U_29945 [Enterocloster clostridioformis]